MSKKSHLLLSLLFILSIGMYAQESHSLKIDLSVDKEAEKSLQKEGRLFVFITTSMRGEPRFNTWPSPGNLIFAKNIQDLNLKQALTIEGGDDWQKLEDWGLEAIPAGTYYVQILWDQDQSESRTDAPGNIYSQKRKITLDADKSIKLSLQNIIPPRELAEHELIKWVDFKSDTLSNWWGKEMRLKAGILLPSDFDDSKTYAIRYNVAGYGGRYTRVNRLLNFKSFMKWWESDESPQIINVFLDGEGPFGDSYQMDSDNSGPYGYALINELIPYIESTYRGTNTAKTRFVDGCSTGGWVSLGLQLYYPEVFNGCFSYSPDAIDFTHYQLINIYENQNAYTNEFGYERPVARTTDGEPQLALRKFIQYENILGASGTYLNSGGQFSAHTALYSPKGENGLPKPLFDPESGEIDPSVAEHWEKYDFSLYTKENWAELGPKLSDKIYIWMGDMDNFYLNPATRAFDQVLQGLDSPKSEAQIEFAPMEGHCQQYNPKTVLEQMQARLESME
ncbi:MAG: alpha/beta hydrolase-fold protein [Bacteroidota bacterium]